MVSEWMDSGNIREFVNKYNRANRVQLVSDGVRSRGDGRD